MPMRFTPTHDGNVRVELNTAIKYGPTVVLTRDQAAGWLKNGITIHRRSGSCEQVNGDQLAELIKGTATCGCCQRIGDLSLTRRDAVTAYVARAA
jgi:hypothetical protein